MGGATSGGTRRCAHRPPPRRRGAIEIAALVLVLSLFALKFCDAEDQDLGCEQRGSSSSPSRFVLCRVELASASLRSAPSRARGRAFPLRRFSLCSVRDASRQANEWTLGAAFVRLCCVPIEQESPHLGWLWSPCGSPATVDHSGRRCRVVSLSQRSWLGRRARLGSQATMRWKPGTGGLSCGR